jgi:hypothetical protein
LPEEPFDYVILPAALGKLGRTKNENEAATHSCARGLRHAATRLPRAAGAEREGVELRSGAFNLIAATLTKSYIRKT